MRRLFVLMLAAFPLMMLMRAIASPVPAPQNSSAVIDALIEQLGSDDFAEREAASARLEKIGGPALDALRAACRNENPEIRNRAIAIVGKLRLCMESEQRLKPKRAKLDYRDVTLGAAVNDLKVQTGLNIELDPNQVANPLRRITCVTQEVPAWEALELFCAAAGLREVFLPELTVPKPVAKRGYTPPFPMPSADGVPVKLVDGKAQRLPGSRSTAVRVLALPPSFPGHRVTLGTGEVSFCLDVTPAPGLGWQNVTGVKLLRVLDSSGRIGGAAVERSHTATIDPNEDGIVFAAGPGVAFRLNDSSIPVYPETTPNNRIISVPLRINTLSAHSLKRLEGIVYAELQASNQQLITVTDPRRHVGEVFSAPGELRFSIQEIKEKPTAKETGMIRMQLQYPSQWLINLRRRGGVNPGWPEAPVASADGNRVEAYDASGKLISVTSARDTEMSDDGFLTMQTIEFRYSPEQGMPAKFIVVGPKPVQVQVPFTLEDVKLP